MRLGILLQLFTDEKLSFFCFLIKGVASISISSEKFFFQRNQKKYSKIVFTTSRRH